jgi:hypothetical protein
MIKEFSPCFLKVAVRSFRRRSRAVIRPNIDRLHQPVRIKAIVNLFGAFFQQPV